MLGVMRKGKTGKHRKATVIRKWCVLAQSPYSPQGNRRQSPKVETTRIEYLSRRITQGASIVKGWEEKLDCRHIHVKQD